MGRGRKVRALKMATAVLAVMLGYEPALAQSTFHVKELDYMQGDWVFETINAYQGGYRVRSERTQWGHELGLGYAVTSWWMPKLLLAFDKQEQGHYDVQRLLFENVFQLKPMPEGQDGIALAWFQSVEAALTSTQTNATDFGPIFSAQAGKFSITTNTFFEKTFGQNREAGINFIFGWQARYEVMNKVKIGVEGYGFVPEIGAARPTPMTGMTHRIGPVLIYEFDLPGVSTSPGSGLRRIPGMMRANAPATHIDMHGPAGAPHAELEFGVLFGTNEYTPDVTGKVNMHISF